MPLQMMNKQLTQNTVIKQLNKAALLLISSIKLENDLLEKGKISALSDIFEKKIQYLQEFNNSEHMLDIFLKSSNFDKSDPALNKLKEIFLELEKVNNRNEILLRANIEAGNKIIEFYKEAQKSKITQNYGYNSQGTIAISKNIEKVTPFTSLNNRV